MAEDEGSPMPGWAAFDEDEEPPARRGVSPTAVVVVAVVVAAGVIAAGALWPEPAPARTAASEPDAGPTALPTASAAPAPTLSTSPSVPADVPAAPGGGASPPAEGTDPPADGAQPRPPPAPPADQGSTASGEPAAPQEPAAPAPQTAPAPAPAAVVRATGPLSAFVTASVPATSPDAVDGANRPVGYAAANLLDGRPGTAWRAAGDLTGQVLTFTFDQPREIAGRGWSTATPRWTRPRTPTATPRAGASPG